MVSCLSSHSEDADQTWAQTRFDYCCLLFIVMTDMRREKKMRSMIVIKQLGMEINYFPYATLKGSDNRQQKVLLTGTRVRYVKGDTRPRHCCKTRRVIKRFRPCKNRLDFSIPHFFSRQVS